jgi:hypothetical protein
MHIEQSAISRSGHNRESRSAISLKYQQLSVANNLRNYEQKLHVG